MIFKNPLFLLLLLVLPALLWRGKKKTPSLKFSNAALTLGLGQGLKLRLLENLVWLRILALGFLIIALSRPVALLKHERIFKEGVDIILAMDVSTSMEALDFTLAGKAYNRLHVVKEVVKQFIANRPNDRIGIVGFAARPYVVCPLTLDQEWLAANLERVRIGLVEDGTAIGSSLMASLNRLKSSNAKTKIIILLTDGRNNAGKISPLTAAEAARALGVKIYTIGAGSKGEVPYPVRDAFGRQTIQMARIDMDEKMLSDIAAATNAQFFLATDTDSLRRIYDKINDLEKTPFKQPVYARHRELFHIYALLGLVIFLLEQLLANTILLKIP